MSKSFWLVVALIIVAFGGIFLVTSKSSGSTSSAKPSQHIEGIGKDNIHLVEYGDYECPYCGEYSPTVTQIASLYNSDITFQFINFPLVSIHQNAFAGARAAEAAALQGKFWQMHDLLYQENQIYYGSNESTSTWITASDPEPDFVAYAQQLGLNTTTFKKDYISNAVNDTINADMAKGNAIKVNATPSFYLNGKQISVNNTTSAFEKVINAAIKARGDTIPAAAAAAGASTNGGTTVQTKK